MGGTLLDNFFDNNINNQCDKLINGAYIYGLNFKCGAATSKDTPLLKILDKGLYLPVSVQNIMDCTGHITGGHNKNAIFFFVGFL